MIGRFVGAISLLGCLGLFAACSGEPSESRDQLGQQAQAHHREGPGGLRTQRVRVTGPRLGVQKLAYWDTGNDAPAIVFVHSNSCSKECWERQFAEVLPDGSPNPLRQYRLLAFDMPGHGDTRRIDGQANTYSIQLYAESVEAFSEALGLHGAVYVGHSLGGHALIESGQFLPEPAGALIYGAPPVSTLEQLGAAFFPMPGGPHYLTADLSAEDIHHWEATVYYSDIPDHFARSVRKTDSRARGDLPASFAYLADEVGMVRDYPCPIGIIHGKYERSVRLSYLESLHLDSELWHDGIQIVDESNHFVSWDQPVVFNSIVKDMADEVNAP
ncbi:MAG: alpha/beta hydrolase [Polyangiaceae bacterium]|nr:alpha/beta hydrolase [Myxococcales bacterium]MCB9589531.1 alpha/beta hydrolase [Polyangiaceae bacterium]MCB9609159.1 alpha/beta hydrolase [Polyangiaceae bacterium]